MLDRPSIRFALALGPALAGCVSVSPLEPPVRHPAEVAELPRQELRLPVADSTVLQPSSPALPLDAPPTWATIYGRYLGPGTEANCARAHCHANAMPDADSAYQWLAQRGYIAGDQPALVGNNSCLRWFGGNMPPRGAPNESAMRDLTAWAAAGARNN